jgi:adenylate isopentenyltransferase (cytokinin synthase)
MRISMSACKQVPPLVNFPGGLHMAPLFRRDKVVIVVGATGTGKSRLAIDLATQFHAEIVNSDKMQVYKGLDIVTNKVTEEECRGVPHHLLGIVDPDSNFTADDFCDHASSVMESITSRDKLPIIAGGSNSYIDALVNHHTEFRMKFECCFLWVDVSLPVLHSFVSERVDRMVDAGLVEEVRKMFDPKADYSRGIRRAIGVPELDQYLRTESRADERTRARLLKAAITKIKENTCILAWRQLHKIRLLHSQWEWDMHRLDATEVFLKRGEEADEAWNRHVAERSNIIVKQFLYDDRVPNIISHEAAASAVIGASVPMAAVAAATR